MSMTFYVDVIDPDRNPADNMDYQEKDEAEYIAKWLAENGHTEAAQRIANLDYRRPVWRTVMDYDITYNLSSIIRRCLGMPDGGSGAAEWAAQCWGSNSIAETFREQRVGDHAERFAAALRYLREHQDELTPLLPSNGWGTMDQVERLFARLAECAVEHPDGVIRVT